LDLSKNIFLIDVDPGISKHSGPEISEKPLNHFRIGYSNNPDLNNIFRTRHSAHPVIDVALESNFLDSRFYIPFNPAYL
jgi:hypothetical protein